MDELRRSHRNPDDAHMEKSEVRLLLSKIKSNHADTVVLKIKDHLRADVSPAVIDAVIDALYGNKVCQALYLQNLAKAFGDKQLKHLSGLLKQKLIWCLNLGENYYVSNGSWVDFCSDLPRTSVTHLYVSEHVIKIELKNLMRLNIRNNRAKHDKHSSFKNIHTIERCTNMWWNPINAIRHQLEMQSSCKKPKFDLKRPQIARALTPNDAAYWAEGQGKGGEVPWKFSCICGETCSSYENYRYHPTGPQYECTSCGVWSHVSCVLGPMVTDEDLEELQEVHCHSCKTKLRRAKQAELRALNLVWKDGKILAATCDDTAASTDGTDDDSEVVKDQIENVGESLVGQVESDSSVAELASTDVLTQAAVDLGHPSMNGESCKDAEGLTDRDDSSRDLDLNSVQSSSSSESQADDMGDKDEAKALQLTACDVAPCAIEDASGMEIAAAASDVDHSCTDPMTAQDALTDKEDLSKEPDSQSLQSSANGLSDVETSSEDGLQPGEVDHDPKQPVNSNTDEPAAPPVQTNPDQLSPWSHFLPLAVPGLHHFESGGKNAVFLPRDIQAGAVLPSYDGCAVDGTEKRLVGVLATEHNGGDSSKRLPALNDLSFSESVFDNEHFHLQEDMRSKKRRMSRGALFQLHSQVYVLDLKRAGVITEEKNGGWKYVKFEGCPSKVEKSKKDHGKWCRAGELVLDEGATSSDCGDGTREQYERSQSAPIHEVSWPAAAMCFTETPFSVPDDFLDTFENQEYWE